jgi:hypothetical protein
VRFAGALHGSSVPNIHSRQRRDGGSPTLELYEAWQEYAEENEFFDHKGRFDALYRRAYGIEK